VDVFLPGTGGAQVHELNPTQFPPVGLFWTVPLPASGVQVDPTSGNAYLRATKVPIFDWTSLENALFMGNNPPPIPGWVSFHVVWKGTGPASEINSTDPTKGIFAGTFIQATAQMQWSAAAGDFTFESDPLDTSISTFAEVGQETNGLFLTTG
jgi:hypothetical protein